MSDAVDYLSEGLQRGLLELSAENETIGQLEKRDEEELREAGRRAVHLAAAPLLWAERLGPTLSTAEVCQALDNSRQAVAKAIDAGRLIAIPAGRTRQFPIWQFNFSDPATVRGEVADLLRTFRAAYAEIRPLQIASWAMTSQPELDGTTPATWLERALPLEPLLLSARRTAAALAQ